MIKLIFGLVFNAFLSMVLVGIWLLFGKIFTGGDYTLDYWGSVQVWFFIIMGIDYTSLAIKVGGKYARR